GAPPPPLPPPKPLPLLRTSLVLRTLELLLLVRRAAAARARVLEVVEGVAGVVVGSAVEVVEAEEVVAAVGVVEGVGALVVAVEAAVGVAVVAGVGLVAVGLALGVRFRRWPAAAAAALDIAAAALGASESVLSITMPTKALHTFTLDSGASCYFFHDSTPLTPLPAPVLVRLADPSGGPVVACYSTVLLCPVFSSGSLAGLHLPSFSTNLVSNAALQDAMVTTTTPGGQR
ncbi:unnamed protein product, partial [Closterium sp. NIES-54]